MAGSIVAGLGSLPRAVASRIEKVHASSDATESLAQASDTSKGAREESLKLIDEILSKKQFGGFLAGTTAPSDDKFVLIFFLKPEEQDVIPSLISQAETALQKTGGLTYLSPDREKIMLAYATESGANIDKLQKEIKKYDFLLGAFIANYVRLLSIEGETVTLFIHQPAALDLFRGLDEDRIAILEKCIRDVFGHSVLWSVKTLPD